MTLQERAKTILEIKAIQQKLALNRFHADAVKLGSSIDAQIKDFMQAVTVQEAPRTASVGSLAKEYALKATAAGANPQHVSWVARCALRDKDPKHAIKNLRTALLHLEDGLSIQE